MSLQDEGITELPLATLNDKRTHITTTVDELAAAYDRWIESNVTRGLSARKRSWRLGIAMLAAPASVQPLFLVPHHTGMQHGEIVRLRWDQIDVKRGVIRLQSSRTNTDENRIIPLDQPLRALFSNLPRSFGGPPVCGNPKTGNPSTPRLRVHGISTHAAAGGDTPCNPA